MAKCGAPVVKRVSERGIFTVARLPVTFDMISLSAFDRRDRARTAAVIVGAWTGVWLVAALLILTRNWLLGVPVDPVRAFMADLPMLALWCAVTPLLLRVGRRWPLHPTLPAVGTHLLVGGTFVVATNLLIRIPELFGGGPGVWFREAGIGLAQYLPPALILYLGIVWLGARTGAGAVESRDQGASTPLDPEGALTLDGSMGTYLVRPDEIVWVSADNNHVQLHLDDGRRLRARTRLSELAEQLEECGFLRIHRSTLVRVREIREVQPLGKGETAVVLRDGTDLRVARGRREAVEAALGVREG